MNGSALFDPGLQPERTDLAWRRSTLSVVVGSLLAFRLLPHVLGTAGFAVGFVGLLAAGIMWLLALRRARRTQLALRQQTALPGARLLLGLATLTAASAAVGLTYLAINR